MSCKALPSGQASAQMSPTDEATARTLILALLHRYASLARERKDDDSQEMAELFEHTATIDFPDGRKLLPSQLGEISRKNPPERLRHHLTTIDVQFVSRNEAHCQSYIVAETNVKMPDHWGRWDDAVVRQSDGRWLFRNKVYSKRSRSSGLAGSEYTPLNIYLGYNRL